MSIIMTSLDSFNCEREIKVGETVYTYYDLNIAEKNGLDGISKLPKSLKVLLENLLRHEDGSTVIKDDIHAMVDWLKTTKSSLKGRGQGFKRPLKGLLKAVKSSLKCLLKPLKCF